MNNCLVCEMETKNKMYCSMKCRDISRKRVSEQKRKQMEEIRHCLNCKTKMVVNKKSGRKYCSLSCSSTDPVANKKRIENMKKTIRKKYGVESVIELDWIQTKIKKTNLKRYGVEHVFQVDSVKKKIVETNRNRYGVDYPQQNSDIKEKSRMTVINKYGGFSLQSEILSKKIRSTMLKRYGVDNVMKSEKFREKRKKTNLRIYGSEYGLSNREVINKRIETLKSKYGVENISQVEEIRKCMNRTLEVEFYNKLINSGRLKHSVPLFSLDEYVGTDYHNKYSFKCLKCGSIFEDHLDNGRTPRCLTCYPRVNSILQKELTTYIKSIYNGKVIENDRKVLNGQELDIYLPDKKLAIEFDGLYWHSELNGKDKYYHLNKTLECKKHGIRLIHIFEDEWLNKKDIVKRKLNDLVGSGIGKIYARSSTIKEISIVDKNKFLEKYHIQGSDVSDIRIGLFYNDLLVSVMTFGNCQSSSKKRNGEYELIRYANSIGIFDGESRLLEYFIKTYSPTKIISYIDLRWSGFDDNLCEKIVGFKFVGRTAPNYWCVMDNQRQDILGENVSLNGIWDCGSLQYSIEF